MAARQTVLLTEFTKTTLFVLTFRVLSHLQFIRQEPLRELFKKMGTQPIIELFSPCNQEKWVNNPLLNFLVHAKFDQIASVNAPT